MRLLRQDMHALTGAYALDAIDRAAERERFTRHVNGCSSCASEVRGFREVATAMAFAAALEPPPAMRAEVLAAVARTRQVPPEVRTHARPRRSRAWVPWLSGAVAAAGIVIAVLFGFAQAHTQHELNTARAQDQSLAAIQARTVRELDQARNQDQLLAAIMAAPHVRVLSQRSASGGAAVVLLASVRHQLIVATSGLPRLPAGKVYQLWLIGPVKVVSAGLLPAQVSGQTAPVVASDVTHGDRLGLTVEPAPGTRQPTTTPIIDLPV
ncbi:MAG TPA: anti-sigma factor [Streptosporangiaceae bacterium]|nr:anti-sigma factor [Streptosporangiaceae bacterium]